MEIRIAKLFQVLVMGGVVLSGCAHTERAAGADEVATPAGAEASGATVEADTAVEADTSTTESSEGVDSWLSWG